MDPNMVGVSPNGLAGMTRGLESNLRDAVQAANNLRSAFAQAQVPTDTIDAIYRTLGIAQDELPMLKRRHSLALKIDDKGKNPFDGTGKLPKGMVAQGAGRITFTTDEQAAQAGKADARAIKSALDHSRSPAEVRSLLQKLKANSGDSVYADALIGILGPKGVAEVSDWAQGAKLNHQD